MTANRRAELQRKLGMVPVPKPPTGLAERIKSEIPKELMVDADKERRRLRQAVSFNIRVAASIILLVSSVYLALNLVSKRFGPMEMAAKSAAPAADTATSTMALPQPVTQLARAREATEATVTTAAPAAAKVAPPATLEARKEEVIVAEARPQSLAFRDAEAAANAKQSSRLEEGVESGVVGGVIGVTAAAPAAPAPMAMPAPPPPPPPAATAGALVERYARAESVPLIPRLEIELAAAPFDEAKQLVRVSIDGRHDEAPRVIFDDETVAAWRAVAADGTALYEVVLRPGEPGDVVAIAYAGDLKRTVRRGDLRAWNEASRRTKAAALAAALAAGVSPADVAAKARAAGLDELAAEADSRRKN